MDCHVISQTWCLESVPRRKRSREGQETSSRQRVCGLCLSVDLKLLHQHASTGTELSQRGDKIKDKALKGKWCLKKPLNVWFALKSTAFLSTWLFSTRGRKNVIISLPFLIVSSWQIRTDFSFCRATFPFPGQPPLRSVHCQRILMSHVFDSLSNLHHSSPKDLKTKN